MESDAGLRKKCGELWSNGHTVGVLIFESRSANGQINGLVPSLFHTSVSPRVELSQWPGEFRG